MSSSAYSSNIVTLSIVPLEDFHQIFAVSGTAFFFFLRRYVTGHECPLPGIIKCLVEKCLLCLSTNVSNLRATDFCSHTEYMPFVALHTVTCITKHASCDLGIICAGRQSLDIHILVIHWARQSTLFKNLDCLFFSVSFSIT